MSIEAFTRLFDEVFTKGNLDAADQLVAPEIIEHQLAPDGIIATSGSPNPRRMATLRNARAAA